jgi:flagellar hook assembly protein FlgD
VIDPATAIAAEQEASSLPLMPALHENYPNPFNPQTTIAYELPQTESVRLTVYDILGREVVRLIDQTQAAGYHEVVWNGLDAAGNSVSSGIYLYRLQAGSYSRVNKMILSR